MPTYEVRRRTVMATAVVTAANETEARILARDAFQQDAAIAALAADVTRQPHLEPYDQERDTLWEQHSGDRDSEVAVRWSLQSNQSDSEAIQPW